MYRLIYKTVLAENGKEYLLSSAMVIGGKEILFPCSINIQNYTKIPYILEIDDLVIVNFRPFTSEESKEIGRLGIDMKRNIWAFDSKGNKAWEIHPADKPKGVVPEIYDSVTLKDGKVVAGNMNERNYLVDISNGNVEWIEGSYSR